MKEVNSVLADAVARRMEAIANFLREGRGELHARKTL
jgi:hypothetical protein